MIFNFIPLILSFINNSYTNKRIILIAESTITELEKNIPAIQSQYNGFLRLIKTLQSGVQ